MWNAGFVDFWAILLTVLAYDFTQQIQNGIPADFDYLGSWGSKIFIIDRLTLLFIKTITMFNSEKK